MHGAGPRGSLDAMRPFALSTLLLLSACAGTDGATGSVTGLTVGGSETEGESTGGEQSTTGSPDESSGGGPTTGVTTTPATTGPSETTSGPSEPTTSGDESSSSGEPPAGLQRYARDMTTGTWSSVPLAELWVGGNAPPSDGITAAVSLTHFDRVFVIADGTVYEQADGTWQTPQPLGRRFPAAAGLQVTAMAHTPGQMSTDVEDLFLVDAPQAAVFRQFENGGVEFVDLADLEDADGGAPQASVDNNWTLAITDPSGIGMDADWHVWYMGFANGVLWRFNAAFEWQMSPTDNNLFFAGAAGEPNPFDIRAAYYDDTLERAYFIAP